MLLWKKGLPVLLLCALGAAAQTQRKPSTTAADNKPKASPVVFEIKLSEDPDFTSMPWANDWPAPSQGYCDGEGNLYVWRWPPGAGLVALTPDGIVPFLSDKMSDIPNPHVHGGFISQSSIYLGVDGIENPKQETMIVEDAEGQERKLQKTVGDERRYIAQFDRDGTYKGRIKLDLPFYVDTFAAFASGTLVAQGRDENQIPRVALLDSGGQLMRYLELPKDLSAVSEIPPNDLKIARGQTASIGAVTMLSGFASSRHGILFLRSLASRRVYEIQESGQVRVVDLKPPEGYDVDGLVATDRNWLVGFRKPNPKGAWSDAEHSFFEVDPQNGDLLIEYRVVPPDTGVSCFSDGTFWAVRLVPEKLIVVHGTAEPHRGK
jgi:hypothetical protein